MTRASLGIDQERRKRTKKDDLQAGLAILIMIGIMAVISFLHYFFNK